MFSLTAVTGAMDHNRTWRIFSVLVSCHLSCPERYVGTHRFSWTRESQEIIIVFLRHQKCSPLITVNFIFIDAKNPPVVWWCGKKCWSKTVSPSKHHSPDLVWCKWFGFISVFHKDKIECHVHPFCSRDKPCHFNIQDYEKFGQHICESLRQYLYVLSDTMYDSEWGSVCCQ